MSFSVFREKLPVEADIQSVLLKQSALNYTTILTNINLFGSVFELHTNYEFSGNSL